jgi:hypothetical protein
MQAKAWSEGARHAMERCCIRQHRIDSFIATHNPYGEGKE